MNLQLYRSWTVDGLPFGIPRIHPKLTPRITCARSYAVFARTALTLQSAELGGLETSTVLNAEVWSLSHYCTPSTLVSWPHQASILLLLWGTCQYRKHRKL